MTPGQGIIALRLLVDQIASIEIELLVEVWRQAVHLHLPLPRHLQKIMSLE